MRIERYSNSGDIRCLKPILESWIDIVQEYISAFDDDVPWTYNERAILSTFAAAIWKNDGIAFEEFSTSKGKGITERVGRCDLFIRTHGGEEFACEAKYRWCPIGSRTWVSTESVKRGIAKARAATKDLNRSDCRQLAILFAVPYLPVVDNNNTDLLIFKWLRSISCINYSCIAWVFPRDTRHHEEEDGGQQLILPGVVMIVKEVK